MTFICAKIVTKMTLLHCEYAVLVLILCCYCVLIHQVPLLYDLLWLVLLVSNGKF